MCVFEQVLRPGTPWPAGARGHPLSLRPMVVTYQWSARWEFPTPPCWSRSMKRHLSPIFIRDTTVTKSTWVWIFINQGCEHPIMNEKLVCSKNTLYYLLEMILCYFPNNVEIGNVIIEKILCILDMLLAMVAWQVAYHLIKYCKRFYLDRYHSKFPQRFAWGKISCANWNARIEFYVV